MEATRQCDWIHLATRWHGICLHNLSSQRADVYCAPEGGAGSNGSGSEMTPSGVFRGEMAKDLNIGGNGQTNDPCHTAADRAAEAGPAPSELPCWQAFSRRHEGRRTQAMWRSTHAILFLVILCGFAGLIVGWEIVTEISFPGMSTGLRHGLLTARAVLVSGIVAAVVYLAMRRQHRRLADTAQQLARLLESYQTNPTTPARFENPHLVACYEALRCEHQECPVRESAEDRCWQVMARHRAEGGFSSPRIDLKQCLECEVYCRSCPNQLTELGEAFNNLMFLLETETRRARSMRSQLVEREKMAAIGLISAGVAHEVGNPLSSISSIVQILKRSNTCKSTGEQLDLIDKHIHRITSIVRQLVTLARPAAENWELLDIGEVLKDVTRLISFDRRARTVDVVFKPPATLPRTFGLRGQLQQVFLNLSLNALDAMPDGGVLQIEAVPRRGHITVRVEDSGCGIAAESGRRVFEPFFTTKPPGRGAGLGLAVSYGIVQKHGGVIEFESKNSRGTVFTVEIPVAKTPPESQDG